jgi:surface antigen
MLAALFYTRRTRLGQSRVLSRVAVLATLAIPLGGCAGLGLPFDEAGAGSQASLNRPAHAIPAAAIVVNQADPSDWDMIRRTAEGAPQTAARLDWSNPTTGSAGSVAIAADNPESLCRAFAVTISDMRGIRRYHGQACQAADGHTHLTGVAADDATLL